MQLRRMRRNMLWGRSGHGRKGRRRPSLKTPGIRYSIAFPIAALACLLCFAQFVRADTTQYRQGALATASPIATDIGVRTFKDGGNAFDVAVAVGIALAVCYPQAGNIGGGGFAVLRDGKTGRIESLDFREVAPGNATEQMYLNSAGDVIENLSTLGAKAAGVPGTVAGLYELWHKYATLPWKNLLAPAIALADTGFIVDDALAESLAEEESGLGSFPETKSIFFPNDRPHATGDRFVQKDLAGTLRLIAASGPTVFYSGSVADKIVACMQNHGGLITHEDLKAYHPKWREPVRFRFDGLDIYSMAPPSSGGIIVGQILKLLEPYDLSLFTSSSPEYIHLFCEAARLAYADRATHLGDPDFYYVPTGLLDSGYLSARRTLIDTIRATPSRQVLPGEPADRESTQTTHFSIADSTGNMVAITYTLNTSYGSKLVVAGAGFLLNNEMDDFSIKPGVPNVYGLVGGEANKVAPNKHMLSSMSPTVVLKDSKPYLILGTPGGSKIITTVAEAILVCVRFGRPLDEAAAMPRFHHQWLPDRLYLEEASFAPGIKEALEQKGHTVEKIPAWCDIQMVAIDSLGVMTAVSDPRRNGEAGGF
ncbi:MAG: gamma-glutamyltransferase [Candidatus Zixiibacteriota bacterium]